MAATSTASDTRRLVPVVVAVDCFLLVMVLLAGGGLRGFYLREFIATPEFNAPVVDAAFHDYWARALATGDWTPPDGEPHPQIQSNAYLRPPGYPHFLATVYRFFGTGSLAPRIVQQLLGLANCLLAFVMVRRWRGRVPAFLCAAFLSFYWPLIYFEVQLLEPTLCATLLLATLCALGSWVRRFAWPFALAAGVLLGLSALVRPNALLLGAVGIAWLCWVGRRGAADGRRRRVGPSVLSFCAGLAAAVAPATVRNYVVAGDTVLISANAGVNLYIGNNPLADGLYKGTLPSLGDFGSCFDYPQIARKLERQLGRPMRFSDVSQYFAAEAFGYIQQHPLDALRLAARKVLLFWSPLELSHNRVVELDRTHSPVLSRLPGGFPFLLASFLVGSLVYFGRIGTSQRRSDPSRDLAGPCSSLGVLIFGFIVAYASSFLPFFNSSLYRIPLVPLLAMFGAVAWQALGRAISERGFVRGATIALIGIGIFLIVRVPWVRYEPNPAEWHDTKGWAFTREGDHAGAESHYRLATRLEPDSALHQRGLARALASQGKPIEAGNAWSEAIRLDPQNPAFHYELGMSWLKRGRRDLAATHLGHAIALGADFGAPYHNLGQLRMEEGKLEEAIHLLTLAIQRDPDSAATRTGLGVALLRAGHVEDAVVELQTATRLDPAYHRAHLYLGLAYRASHQPAKAIRSLRTATMLEPTHVGTRLDLVAALESAGVLEEAAEQLEMILRLEPDNAIATEKLQKLRDAGRRPDHQPER